jgi:hypothetical protein
MGMTVMVIGWLYLFGGLSGGRRIVAASVLDRVVLVPLVLVPLVVTRVFPHFLLAFAVLEPTLGIRAWLLLSRLEHPRFSSIAGTPSLELLFLQMFRICIAGGSKCALYCASFGNQGSEQ